MSEANWVDRASKRIDAWPVGPLAALLLGAATGFFCWAMPYSPAIGRLVLIVAPGLLAFVTTLAVFRWVDGQNSPALADEGDEQEDWLTRPARPRRPVETAPAADRQPIRPSGRPFIIDAIDDDEADPAPQGGWPLPLVDRMPPAPPVPSIDIMPSTPFAADELLLDAPLPQAGEAPPAMVAPSALPIEDLMARLASRIEGREAAAPLRRAPPSDVAPTPPMPAPSPLSDVEALHAALADLHRMARRS